MKILIVSAIVDTVSIQITPEQLALLTVDTVLLVPSGSRQALRGQKAPARI